MSGSGFGNYFHIETYGESHGKAVGVIVDGCPAGLKLCEEDIQKYLNRRRPGQSLFSTPRKESDTVNILSGVFEGKTTGTPISMMIENTSHHSADYSEISQIYRPGHADYTFDAKYGFRDYRGGGRSSGRETIGRVAAGAIAAKILESVGIRFTTYARAIGDIEIDEKRFDIEQIHHNPFFMPDATAAKEAETYVRTCMERFDSVGGIVECRINGVMPGLGEPVFMKLDALLAQAILSIGAVKGFEIGDGFAAAKNTGSINNDVFEQTDGTLIKKSNHAGGVLGGISDGSEIVFRAAIKPTPSIFSEQQTINKDFENVTIKIKGRHDPIIVPRAVVVVECMAAVTLTDLLFANMHSRMDYIKKIYDSVN